MKKKFKVMLVLVCLLSFVFTSTGLASLSNENIETKALLQMANDGSLTPSGKNVLLEKLEQGDAIVVEWFKNLSINDPNKIEDALKDGVVVYNGEVVNVDFGDGSSIELSLEILPSKNLKRDYLVTPLWHTTYKHKVLGIPVAYYYIYCEYGFNSMDGPCTIIDTWDDSAQLYTYDVIKNGVTIITDNANPIKVRGRAEIRQLNTTLANVRGDFTLSTDFDSNYCTWTVN